MDEIINVTINDSQEIVKLTLDSEGVTKPELEALNVAFTNIDNDFDVVQTVQGIKTTDENSSELFFGDGSVKELTTNTTNTVVFSSYNNWINKQQTPITSAITYDLTNAINGAVSCVYYQAPTLDITDTSNRIVIQNESAFIANELCLVWFVYDAGSGAIHVNVQSGDTGNRPNPVGTEYGIQFVEANSNALIIPKSINANSNIKITVNSYDPTQKYLLSNQLGSSVNGAVHIVSSASAGVLRFRCRDNVSSKQIDPSGITLPSEFEIQLTSGTSVEYFINGGSIGSFALDSFNISANDLIIGAFNSAGALCQDMVLNSFEVDGETFDCNEGTGTTVTGSLGTICTLVNSPSWVVL